MRWIAMEERKPPDGEYVLVWNARRGFATVAKYQRKRFSCVGCTHKVADVSHWAEVLAPDGQTKSRQQLWARPAFTKKDSQNS